MQSLLTSSLFPLASLYDSSIVTSLILIFQDILVLIHLPAQETPLVVAEAHRVFRLLGQRGLQIVINGVSSMHIRPNTHLVLVAVPRQRVADLLRVRLLALYASVSVGK